MKTCSKCNKNKNLIDFYVDKAYKDGHAKTCKECKKQATGAYYKENKDKRKIYELENKEKLNAKRREYEKQKLKSDVSYRLRKYLRSRINSAIRFKFKSGSAVKDLGCSIEYLKQYIEGKFVEGMSWSNHGKWHIDHIKPLGNFDLSKREKFLEACHYTNLQPLWAEDNRQKSNNQE